MKLDQTNLNTELWSQIESFILDFPISAYNFSTRLAAENNWTKYFTQKAILEYRKFMYLAANAEVMISPSETVDKVWHLHLIFTKSYADFCALLGKTVHHIPSTRAANEHSKFLQAKENTERLIKTYSAICLPTPGCMMMFTTRLAGIRQKQAQPCFLLM